MLGLYLPLFLCRGVDSRTSVVICIVICSESISCKSLYVPHISFSHSDISLYSFSLVHTWVKTRRKPNGTFNAILPLSVHLSEFAVLKIGFRDCYIVGKHITTEVDPSLLKIFSFALTGI